MASLASINIRFRADLKGFSTDMQNSLREIDKVGQKLQSVGRGLSAAITLPIVGLGIASLKTFGDIEALQRGLTAVMGSAELASVEFEKLKEVAKLPGLGLEEAVRGSVNLQAAGFSADEARRALLSFGNALATVGKGKRELDLVTLAITQLNNKSGGFGQDLRQLTEQLPQLRGALKNAFGTVDTEKISKSGVTGREVVNALITEFDKLPKVTGGLNNAFENFGDSSKLAFNNIGAAINKAFNVEGLLNSFGDSLNGVSEKFANLSEESQKAILIFAGVAAAIGPILVAIGAVTAIVPSVVAGLAAIKGAFISLNATIAANPFGALAIALATIVSLILISGSRFSELTNAEKEFADINGVATQNVAKQSSELQKNIGIAKNKNLSDKTREQAIKNINNISPELLGNITLENLYTKQATDAVKKYTEAILIKAKVQAAEEKLIDVQKRLLDLQLANLDAVKPTVWQNLGNAILSGGNAMIFASNSAQTIAKNLGIETDQLVKLQNALTDFVGKNATATESTDVLSDSVLDLSKATEKVFNAGTIAFYEAQISAIQKLQKETVTSTDAWIKYELAIGEVQKKIDALENKAGVKLPKPIVTDQITAPADFSLGDLKAIKSNYEQIREEFSTTSAEYEKLTGKINNTELKINAIEGVDEVNAKFADIQDSSLELKNSLESTLGTGLNDIFSSFSAGFVESLGLAENGLKGFVGGLVQTVTKLLALMLSASISQSIAGATASGVATGPAAIFTTPAFIATAVGGVLAAFASIPKFATGGIIGGSSYSGDKLLARVNSGEMIFNQKQQANLNGMLRNTSSTDSAVNLFGGFNVSGDTLKLIIDRSEVKKNRTS
jgi:tape measure domain-containing protein